MEIMTHLARLRAGLLPLFIVLLTVPVFAADLHTEAGDAWWVTKKMITSPLRGSAQDYVLAGVIVSGVAFTSILDNDIRTAILKQNGGWTKPVDKIGHEAQGPIAIFGTAGALYAGGWLADEPSLRRTGIEIVEAYAIAATGTHILKRAVSRHRPYLDDGNYRFTPLTIFSNAHHSFPSGDVTVVFSTASVLAAEADWWPVTVACYGVGAMTAFQRIHKNQHWFSDTVGAAVWSTAVGLGVVHYNRSLPRHKAAPTLSAGPNSIGLLWSF
jgi:membrane-associated phospholipid phosphatase